MQSAAEVLAELAAATADLLADAGGLTDATARGPSLLAGWSRGHVLTHLARNAEGGTRLLGFMLGQAHLGQPDLIKDAAADIAFTAAVPSPQGVNLSLGAVVLPGALLVSLQSQFGIGIGCQTIHFSQAVEAAAVGLHALQLSDDTRSSLVVDWLIRFDRSLRARYPELPEAASFHEQLRQYVRKAAPLRAGELS